jgi:hypothetical protein
MIHFGGDEDDCDWQEDENTIPGDNDKQSDEKWPSNKDAPTNMTIVPQTDTPASKDLGGD